MPVLSRITHTDSGVFKDGGVDWMKATFIKAHDPKETMRSRGEQFPLRRTVTEAHES